MTAGDEGKKRGYLRIGAASAVLALLVLVGFMWDWNWFRSLVEERISAEIGRPVQIGHFDIEALFSRQPLIVLDSIAVGNPPNFPSGSRLGSIDRLSVRIDLGRLLRSLGAEVVLPEIAVEHPNGDLRPGPGGNPNWVFDLPASSSGSGSASSPQIGALVISDGNFRIADPKLKADIIVAVHTETGKAGHEDQLFVSVRGTYAGQPITGSFVGGTLLSLRNPNEPYPVDLKLVNGSIQVRLKGVIQDPLKFAGADLQLELGGDNLADLYRLTGIPLAPTPPFHLVGHLDYTQNKIRFEKFTGTVGASDLQGDFDVERAGLVRPLVTANLTSRSVVFADLAGFIGSTPGKADAANDTQELKTERAEEAAKPKVIPDLPIDLPKLRSADFDVTYFGQQLQSTSTPFDNVRAKLTIENGKVSLLPLSFGIGKSAITGNIHLDPAEKEQVDANADIEFHQIDLQRVLQKIADLKGSGLVDGTMHIKGSGNSLSQILASGSGGLDASMTGGDLRALLIDLAGLDLGKAALSWIGVPDRTALRCMIADFAIEQGMLQTRTLLFDTDEANLVGVGGINLKDESLALEITTQPKHVSLGRLPLPIEVGGTLKKPTIRPGLKIVNQGGPAATLLSLLTIQLGQGQDNDCHALLDRAAHAAAPAFPGRGQR